MSHNSVNRPWNETDLFEDFLGAYVDGNRLYTRAGTWVVTSSAGTPSMSVRQSESHAPGIVRITTDESSGDDATLLYSGTPEQTAMMDEVLAVEGRLRVSHATNLSFEVGVDEGSFVGTGEAVFCGLDGGDIALYGRNGAGTVRVKTTTAALVAGAWHRFKIVRAQWVRDYGYDSPSHIWVRNAGGDSAGSSGFKHTSPLSSDMPGAIDGGATAAPVYFGARVKTTTAAARWLELDALRLVTRHSRAK